MHEELDANRLSRIRRHVDSRVNPRLRVTTLMEDRLQDRARGICDVGILPVEHDVIVGIMPMPEAQCPSASRRHELLVERAVAQWFCPRDVASQGGERPTVHLCGADHGRSMHTVNEPRREITRLESAVYDGPTIARRRRGCRSIHWCGRRSWSWARRS